MDKPLFVEKSELLRGVLPAQRNVEVIPMPKFVRFDPMLDGNYRFCKTLGPNVANMVSNTLFQITEAAIAGDNELVTNSTTLGDLVGVLILLDNTEACIVSSVSESRNDFGVTYLTMRTESDFHFNHVVGESCALEAFEVFTSNGASFPSGSTFMQLTTKRPLVAGDQIAKLVNSSFNAVLSNYVEIEQVSLDSVSGDYFNYSVTVKPLTFSVSGDRLFVKAVPAYASNKLQLQTTSSYVVLDSLHGKTFGQGQSNVTIGLQTFDVAGNVLTCNFLHVGDMLEVSPLRTHEIAAMHVERGSVRYAEAQTCFCDSEGIFCLGAQFHEMELGIAFTLSGYGTLIVETDVVETMTVDGYARYTRTAVTEKFILRFVSAPGSSFKLTDAYKTTGRIHSMQYTLSADISTGEEFSLSGLLLKPVFKSVLDCTPDTDVVDLNMGIILT